MRTPVLFIFLALTVVSCTRKSDYENRVDKFRSQTIGFYVNPKESPLDSNELKTFKGIKYFPIDESYCIEAKMVRLPVVVPFSMSFTGGDVQTYSKVAELHFELNGKPQVLFAYQTGEMVALHQLFVPFTDATSGKESYSGGRYLDVNYDPSSDQVMLDFNFAYTPFCAYTHTYSCPVVPKENAMTEPVRAGEMLR